MNLNDRRKNAEQNENQKLPNSDNSMNITSKSNQQTQELLQKQADKIAELQEWLKQKDVKMQNQASMIQKKSSELQMLQSKLEELKEELSDTRKLCHELQKSNDDLRNNAGVNTIAEQKKLNERITKVIAVNKSLQDQVSMSNVEAVTQAKEETRKACQRAIKAERAKEKAEKDANSAIKDANKKIQKAQNDADKKYREMVGDYRCKHLLITAYCLIVTIMQFVLSERCRTDSAAFFGGIAGIIKAVAGWEKGLFTYGTAGIVGGIIGMIGIPVVVILFIIILIALYRGVCMKQNISGCSVDETQHAVFRTEIVTLITAVMPLYLVDVLPEGCNYWGIFLTMQGVYFVYCCFRKDDGYDRW